MNSRARAPGGREAELAEQLQAIMVDVEYLAFAVDHACWNMVGDDAAHLAEELNRLRGRCRELAGQIGARERALGKFPDARPATVVRDSHGWYIRDGQFETTLVRRSTSARLLQVASWTRDLLVSSSVDVDHDTRVLLYDVAHQLEDEATSIEPSDVVASGSRGAARHNQMPSVVSSHGSDEIGEAGRAR
jgi:DNA-binding ferritin-like protein